VDAEDGGTPGVDAEDGGTPGMNAMDDAEDGGTTGVDAEDDGTHQTALERDMNDKYGPRNERYNMRKRREPNYSHLFANTDTDEPLATPQMSMKKGLKMFGEDGVAAVKSEMLQLHERKVMEPRKSTELSDEQKREALAYLMFLKRKRCGKIKGRGCADGRKQRAYIDRADAASPTVAVRHLPGIKTGHPGVADVVAGDVIDTATVRTIA
jgi:hypothetical protein